LSWQRVYEILLKATVLAAIITVPPILGLFWIWRRGEGLLLLIVMWTIATVLWNIVVLVLFIRGKIFKS